jgi:hypothetical protein
MIAADVVGDGHYTAYPSGQFTHALQIPFKGGVLPGHTVQHSGTCSGTIDGDDADVGLKYFTDQS